jgi:hypothetical protein
MPVLDADEHVGDGEIVGDPLVFRGALDPLNSSGGSALDVTNVGIFSGDMVTPQQRIGSMLATSATRTRNLSNPLMVQPIVGSYLGSNISSNNLGSNIPNLGSNISNHGSNILNLGSNTSNHGSNLGSISNIIGANNGNINS